MQELYRNIVRLVAIAEGYRGLLPAWHLLPEPRLQRAMSRLSLAIYEAQEKMVGIRATGDISGLNDWVYRWRLELEQEASQLPGFSNRFAHLTTERTPRANVVTLRPVEAESFLRNFVDAGTTAIASISNTGSGSFKPAQRTVLVGDKPFAVGAVDHDASLPFPVDVKKEKKGPVMRGKTRREKRERLHFVFRGPTTRGRMIVAGSEAELVFRYDIPASDAVATVDSLSLEKARRANLSICLEVTAGPGLSVLGDRSALARFSGGGMTAEVVFKIAADDTPRNSKLQVDFSVAGEFVHQTEIEVQLVKDLDALTEAGPPKGAGEGPPPKGTDLDIAHAVITAAGVSARLPRRRIKLHLSLPGDRFRIGLTDYRGANLEYDQEFISSTIDRAKLQVLLDTVRNELQGCYESPIWITFDGSQEATRPPEVGPALGRTVRTIASAGWFLNHSLRTDARIADALEYIETKAEPGTTITISTEDLFLPWEILYPRFHSQNMTPEQKAANPLDPALIWGARFAIETVQRGGICIGELRRNHISSPPKVSVNFNPAIKVPEIPEPKQPSAVHREWAGRLQKAGRLDREVHQECTEIRDVLQNATDEATVYYVYCHGSSASPFGGVAEELQLTEDCPLKPIDLAGGQKAYSGAPIVILNSCKAGAVSALTFTSFLTEFRRRGALGLIATIYSVPITFAGRFGESLVELCLRRHGSLADDLLKVRRHHLLDLGNPVPLFYTLQCQLNRDPAS